jgi:hypothetical protein
MSDLLAALGLPDNTIAFNFRGRVNRPATITCAYYADEGMALHIGRYLVCEREPIEKES